MAVGSSVYSSAKASMAGIVSVAVRVTSGASARGVTRLIAYASAGANSIAASSMRAATTSIALVHAKIIAGTSARTSYSGKVSIAARFKAAAWMLARRMVKPKVDPEYLIQHPMVVRLIDYPVVIRTIDYPNPARMMLL
jgi:hypothetical protein